MRTRLALLGVFACSCGVDGWSIDSGPYDEQSVYDISDSVLARLDLVHPGAKRAVETMRLDIVIEHAPSVSDACRQFEGGGVVVVGCVEWKWPVTITVATRYGADGKLDPCLSHTSLAHELLHVALMRIELSKLPNEHEWPYFWAPGHGNELSMDEQNYDDIESLCAQPTTNPIAP